MRWARDEVAEDRVVLIRSVKSLLTVTTRVTVVGTDAVPIAVQGIQDVAGTAIATLTTQDGDVIATVITTIAGVAAGKAFPGGALSRHS